MGTFGWTIYRTAKMLRGVLLLCVLGAAVEGNRFMKHVAWSNVMQKCFGEETYLEWGTKVHLAKMECYKMPVGLPEHDKEGMESMEETELDVKDDKPTFVLYLPNGEELKLDFKVLPEKRDNHSPLYSADLLKKMYM